MKACPAAIDPNAQPCAGCTVRPLSICASLDKAEMGAFEQFGRHVHFSACDTVFAEEEITTSFYSVLDGAIRLYKLLADGRRQTVGFGLPGDFLGMNTSRRNNFSADTIGPVEVCRFSKAPFLRFAQDKPHLLGRIIELAIRELSGHGTTWSCWAAVPPRRRSRNS